MGKPQSLTPFFQGLMHPGRRAVAYGQERSFEIEAADCMQELIAQVQVRQQPSKSRKTTEAQQIAGAIIRRSERKPIPPGEDVQAVRKRMTSAQSLVDRATSS